MPLNLFLLKKYDIIKEKSGRRIFLMVTLYEIDRVNYAKLPDMDTGEA